ncbi:hypothetical protein PENTCL1PPCAC_15110, partial [Pristionchus entomophagus]
QTYSVLLFNTAVTDTIACLSDAFSMIRIVVDRPAIFYVYQGICGVISESTCFFLYSLMIHLAIHSIMLIAIGFWYRSGCCAALAPTALLHVSRYIRKVVSRLPMQAQFQWADSPRDQVVDMLDYIYPTMNATILKVGGNVSTTEPHSMITTLYVCLLPFIIYSVIIQLRKQVKNKLAAVENMSEKTKSMHETLVKALTIHAMLPMSLCLGVGSFLLMTAGVPRNELLESFATMGVTFPSAVNPILTLYFVRP